MAGPFEIWLERVLVHGESIQPLAPAAEAGDRLRCLPMLHAAFVQRSLSLAGPPIDFAPEPAWHAARLLAEACWRLVGSAGDEPLTETIPDGATAADHLSIDLTLRFLPSVLRRAGALSHATSLAEELERILRRRPLSGVLADLDGEPTVAPEFAGHPGLELLYAERLVKTGRAGWVPQAGTAREWVERVFTERGRPLPVPATKEENDDD